MTDALTVKEWVIFAVTMLAYAFAFGVAWAKLNGKIDTAKLEREQIKRDAHREHQELLADIQERATHEQLNGMGQRVDSIKNDCANQSGRMDRFEREVNELRMLAQGASDKMTRVDKGVSDLSETVRDGNIALGVQLGELNKTIAAMDKNLGTRLTRVETVQKIEQKIGPLPTE